MKSIFNPSKLHRLQLRALVALAVFFMCTGLSAQTPGFVSFDAPDAGQSKNQGTIGTSINQNGAITGWYVDSSGVVHGFLRRSNGQITEFDPPTLSETFPKAINVHGQIVGFAARTVSHTSHEHGFLRNGNGGFVKIDVSGAADTEPAGINDAGQITGAYDDSSGLWHGFVRDSAGTYTLFDVPDAGTGPGQGTTAVAINANAQITGFYVDASNQRHGFVRDQLGNFTTFDAAGTGTQPVAINSSGALAGIYADAHSLTHSFLRDALGNITTVDRPGAKETFANSINDQGFIVGEAVNSPTSFTGFRRSSNGTYTAVSAPPPSGGTDAISINNTGKITGSYVDVNGVSHGFVR